MRKEYCVGASVASIGALALNLADTPTRRIYYFLFFSRYPTLCVWGKHSAWQSTAEIGGGSPRAVVANMPRQFGQKPEPTLFCKGMFTKVKVIDWEERKQKQLRFG